MENFPTLIDYALALLFGFIIPFISGIRSKEVMQQVQFDVPTRKRFYLGNSLFLFIGAAIVIIVWWLFDRPFGKLGFASPVSDNITITIVLIAVFVFLYIADTISSVYSQEELEKTRQQQENTPFMPEGWKEFPAYLVMCVSAAVCEEIVFRGYMVTLCESIFPNTTNGKGWAVFVPAAVFSVAHFYQGKRAVLKIFVLSVLFGHLFQYSGSLIYVIVLHFLVDAVGGILSIKLIRRNK